MAREDKGRKTAAAMTVSLERNWSSWYKDTLERTLVDGRIG